MKTTILLTVFFFCSVLVANGQWSNSTNLSGPKWRMGETTLGTKAYFAGGHNGSITLSTVETYDVKTGLWNFIGNLNIARQVITGVSCGSKVYFAGGINSAMNTTYSTVDIYDTITRQWSVKQLSIPRFDLAAVSKGNKVLFAGGSLFDFTGYKVVDIYNTQTDSWSTANLSMARGGMAYAVVGDLAIFAGGILTGGALSNRVDIYNFVTDKWSTANLSQARCWASATVLGNKVLIAGGMKSLFDIPSDRVDIYDASNGTWSTASLFFARAWISSGTVNGKAYFAGGSNVGNGGITHDYSDKIDIYDGNTWSMDFLLQPRCSAGLVLGDKFLIAGGKNSTGVLSSVVIFPDTISGTTSNPMEAAFFKVYPNPVSEKITVEFPGWGQTTDGTITIYGIAGQQLMSQKMIGLKSEIAVNNLPSGLYFIKLVSTNKTGIGRIVKN